MKTVPLRHVAEVRSSSVDKKSHDGESPVRLCNYMDVYRNDRVYPEIDLMVATATEEEVERFRLEVGDSIITKDSEDPTDIGVSAFVERTAPDFVCGYHLAIVRPNDDVHDRYLNWALRGREVLSHWSSHASGMTRYGLSLAGIKAAPIRIPGAEQQRRIADFLDDRVARIDRISAARRQQLSKMDEQLTVRVRDAVAGVLDGDLGHHRDDLPWVSRVAADAVAVSLARVVTLQRGVDLTEDERLPGPVQVVTTAGVVGMHDRAIGSGPGVVIGRYGSVGNVHWVEGPYWPHNTTLYVKDTFGNDLRWVYYLLRSFPYAAMQARAAIPGVNRNDMATELVPWIPVSRQRASAGWLDEKVTKHRQQREQLTRSVELLTEYKTSLITAAVTGELDITTTGSGIPG